MQQVRDTLDLAASFRWLQSQALPSLAARPFRTRAMSDGLRPLRRLHSGGRCAGDPLPSRAPDLHVGGGADRAGLRDPQNLPRRMAESFIIIVDDFDPIPESIWSALAGIEPLLSLDDMAGSNRMLGKFPAQAKGACGQKLPGDPLQRDPNRVQAKSLDANGDLGSGQQRYAGGAE